MDWIAKVNVDISVADPDRDADPYHFQDPDPFPGCIGSGSISYSSEHNKMTWKGKFNKEYLLCRSCWTY